MEGFEGFQIRLNLQNNPIKFWKFYLPVNSVTNVCSNKHFRETELSQSVTNK